MRAMVITSSPMRRRAGIPFRASSQFFFRMRRTRMSDMGFRPFLDGDPALACTDEPEQVPHLGNRGHIFVRSFERP